MKIVIAPDSFKGSLSATEVAAQIQRAFGDVWPHADIVSVPMADGGEGTLDALVRATQGEMVEVTVNGPLLTPLPAHYGILGDGKTVVIEMARAAGITLVDEPNRNPLHTSTYGVGELFRHALDAGYRNFVVAIGGSATNDGGLGFLQALGTEFLDSEGNSVLGVGGSLPHIRHVHLDKLDSRLAECSIVTASDVENPLCGAEGASAVFGPQKGATPETVRFLDDGLRHYADLVEAAFGCSHRDLPGAGAAGGLGFAIRCIGGQFASGARLVAQEARLAEKLNGADFVITGEGKTDTQTLFGKVPYVVAQMARERNVKAILLSGSLVDVGGGSVDGAGDGLRSLALEVDGFANAGGQADGFVKAGEQADAQVDGQSKRSLEETFVSMHSILPRPMSTEAAMSDAPTLLYNAARNLALLMRAVARTGERALGD